ncbi:MAG: hypothetical protein AAGG53_04620 [Cyanobacteria bacterium P01_H01_bin.152]
MPVAISRRCDDSGSPKGEDQPDAVLPTFRSRVAPDLRDRP